MDLSQNAQNLIEGFIHTQVINRGLDERTMKAYRQDLELLFGWLEPEEVRENTEKRAGVPASDLEKHIQAYLDYLIKEKGLQFSTVCRRYQVFGYFLSYLKSVGLLKKVSPLELPKQPEQAAVVTFLTKKEVDLFFQAISQEYDELNSEFRKRICLRDQVMMGLLFYHGIEISELLRLEVTDYQRKTSVLTIRRKKEQERPVFLFSHRLQRQMEQWLFVEHGYFECEDLYHNRMFLSKLGKPLSMKMVTNIFDKYRRMAGIEKECSPKDLKNSLGRYGEELVREKNG